MIASVDNADVSAKNVAVARSTKLRNKLAQIGITPNQFILELANCEALFFRLVDSGDVYGLSASDIVNLQCDIHDFNARHTFQLSFECYRELAEEEGEQRPICFTIVCTSESHMTVDELISMIAMFRPYMFDEAGVYSDFIAHLVEHFPRNRTTEPTQRLLNWPSTFKTTESNSQ